MATKLLYLNDFEVLTGSAHVESVVKSDGRYDVVLDQTCFYPRGGGQDWDTGTISSGSVVFMASEVRIDEDGVVHHIGVFESAEVSVGETVELHVEPQRRLLNTRLHSAGHLIDMAVDELGYSWVPGKGAHYPHMSNVEYSGEWDPDKKTEVMTALQELVDQYVAKGGRNEIRFIPKAEMASICRHVPDNVPTNKPSRVVIYRGTFGVPCGGTHVTDLSDVGQVSIDRIKKKSGAIRVSYSLKD